MGCYSNQPERSAIEYSLAKSGLGLRLSNNFTLVEFASKDGADKVLVHPALILLVQDIRDHFKVPVHITSRYRTQTHNRNIGGASNSRHMYGLAADIIVRGVESSLVQNYAIKIGAGGVGRYPTFTHVDVWREGRRF